MIVRISGEGQYQVTDDLVEELNRIDNDLVGVVRDGDRARFHRLFGQMLEAIRSRGEALEVGELRGSDVILPPSDTTMEEARDHFRGEGAIPD